VSESIDTRLSNLGVEVQSLKDLLEEVHQTGEVDLTQVIGLVDNIILTLATFEQDSDAEPAAAEDADGADTGEAIETNELGDPVEADSDEG
jgi:hypothetical protein